MVGLGGLVMLDEDEINRELKNLIKYIKSKNVLNRLYHESIVKVIDNFYIDEGEKNGNNKRDRD